MKAGIAPELLVSQVKNTAAWLWSDPRGDAATRVLDDLSAAEESHRSGAGTSYLALLLAAHFATVATFVPTDVDARIRHHAWQAMTTAAEIAAACDLVDTVAAWDVHAVSARVFVSPNHGAVSGHDGEWFSVRAGALGRAATLGARELVDRLAAQLDAELDREEVIAREVLAEGAASPALTVATIVAHNLGDLSRVVAEWPKHELLVALRDRYVRLAHPDAPTRRRPFVVAGMLNKALVAHENHRFLPLRKPRALRTARELLLPIGPWLEDWGAMLAKSAHLEDRDRAEVLAALLELHERGPTQEGCLRAIVGLHHATRGGIEVFVPDLPARMRKDALRGRVREALDVSRERFDARVERRFRAEIEGLPADLRG